MIVSAGWGATSFAWYPAPTTTYLWPSPATKLTLTWAAGTACNPSAAGAQMASNYTQGGAVAMTLYTHAQYRFDYALSLDPATGAPTAGQPWPYRNPANKVVAFLWRVRGRTGVGTRGAE